MSNPIVPAVVIGGVVYIATKPAGPPEGPGDTAYGASRDGATTGDITAGAPNGGGGYGYGSTVDDSGQGAFNTGGRPVDPDVRQKVDLLNVAMEKAYSGMSSAAKSAAADTLNRNLNLDPPMTGNETWDQVARIAGGAVAAAGCSAIPGIGVAAAPLCSMAGAYLGVKLEQWIQSPLKDLGNWIEDNVGGAIDAVGDALSDAWNSVF